MTYDRLGLMKLAATALDDDSGQARRLAIGNLVAALAEALSDCAHLTILVRDLESRLEKLEEPEDFEPFHERAARADAAEEEEERRLPYIVKGDTP